MFVIHQNALQNRLLRFVSAEAFALLQPGLEPIDLNSGDVLSEAGKACQWLFLPESGIISVVARIAKGRELEIGLFGRDGAGPTANILGVDHSPHQIIVQAPGTGHRISTGRLAEATARNQGLRAIFLNYVQTFLLQVSQTALSNGAFNIETRLARWLLLMHDRQDGDEIRITHEFLSTMLGVRRTGVTLAIHMLESQSAVHGRRGALTVRNRGKLESIAAEGYGQAEREYERLIGVMR